MAEQDVSGIALGLTLDTTGWSSGIARAKAELDGLKRSAANIEVGVGVRGGGGGRAGGTFAGGPAAVAGIPGAANAAAPVVSPRFQVSAASVRQLRVDINAQLRQLSQGGEAVQVPVRLGRVPYATMRTEIATGIGEVPVRFKPDAGSLTAFAAVLSSMTGQTPGRARAAIQQAAAERGIPARKYGGTATPGRPMLVGEEGPEVIVPRMAGMVVPMKRALGGAASAVQKYDREFKQWRDSILKFGQGISPSTYRGPARDWYQIAQAQVLGDLADFRYTNRRAGLAAAASASPGQPWPPNRGILRNVLRTGQAPLGTFEEHVPGFGTQKVTAPYSNDPRVRAHQIISTGHIGALSGPKTVPFFKNLSGEDLEAWTLDARQARIATNNVMKQSPKEGSWQRHVLEAAHEAAYPELKKMWGIKHRSQAQAILWSGYGRGEDLGDDWSMTDSDILIPRHPGIRVPRVGRWKGGRAKAYRETLEHEGGTFGLRGDLPQGRYAVSTTGQQRVVDAADRLGFLRNFRDVGKDSPYVGTWMHEGQIYVDPVTVRRHKADALRIARANEQLAIFDLKRMKEIPVKRAFGGEASSSLSRSQPLLRRLRVAGETEPWPGYSPDAQAYEMSTRPGGNPDEGPKIARALEMSLAEQTMRERETWSQKTMWPEHSTAPRLRKPPKGVKFRFSPEWSDYPDPSKFFTSAGPFVGPTTSTDPFRLGQQLQLGYHQPMGGAYGPYFEPNARDVDPPMRRFRSLAEWLQKGAKIPGVDAGYRPSITAYALDQKNRVLGHALVSATMDVPDYGKNAGKATPVLHPDYVWAHPEMKGKGLASGMYSRLEAFLGMPVAPSNSQTAWGRRLWSKPAEERSFGRAFKTRNYPSAEDVQRQIEDERNYSLYGAQSFYGQGWKANDAVAEPYRDFSRAVDPLTKLRRGRVKGQLKLPGFARGGRIAADGFFAGKNGGLMMMDGRPLSPEDVMAWETQLRETSRGPKFPMNGGLFPIDPRWLPKRAGKALGGAMADMGKYIIGEIGRELFVPKRMEGIIPPDVAAQLPDGQSLLARLMMGRARARGGGVKEIGGRGAQPWDATEDGWIIPNRLMHRVPRHAGGSVHFHNGQNGRQIFHDARGRFISAAQYQAAMFAQQQQWNANARNVNTPGGLSGFRASAAPTPTAPTVLERNEDVLSAVRGLGDRAPFNREAALEAEQIRLNNAAIRGLTGRAAVGGIAGFIGGGRARREAQARVRVGNREIQSLLPKGVDDVEELSNVTGTLGAQAKETTTFLGDLTKQGKQGSVEFQKATVQLRELNKTHSDYSSRLERIGEIERQRDKDIQKSQGGAAANLLSVTAAGVAFNAGMRILGLGLQGAEKVLEPVVDQLTGFATTGPRVTKSLADMLPQAGTLSTLFAQQGLQAGLGPGPSDFLQGRLGGAVYAKAGATAAGNASDLFRASVSTAPSGLIGGYGGFLGGDIGAQLFGGGKGLLQTLAGDAALLRGQSSSTGVGGVIETQVKNLGKGWASMVSGLTGDYSNLRRAQTVTVDRRAADAQLQYINEAIDRGRVASGLDRGGVAYKDVGIGSAEAKQILDTQGLDDYTRQLAEGGVVLKDAAGQLIKTQQGINDAIGQAAKGLTLPDATTFARAQAQQLSAAAQQSAARGEYERNIAIPGQLGQQVTANPFVAASTGLAKGFQPTIANLKTIQELQDGITQDAKAAVEAQAQQVDQNLGTQQGIQFRGYMAQVKQYGDQIAGLNSQLADAQAQAGLVQYNYQLKVLNRNIRDAKGLAGQGGGSRLGNLQRDQWELQRESQRLSLESQQLANQMAQRQINFNVAVAGFQAPGITGQERAARLEEAQVQAEYEQRQLNIQKRQTGIAGEQYGNEGAIFGLQTSIAVQDLEMQKTVLQENHRLEQEQIAVQKELNALNIKQSQVQAKAQSLFNEATGNFDQRLSAAGSYVAQFGGTVAAALGAVKRAIDVLNGRSSTPGTSPGADARRRHATGALFTTNAPYDMTVGEAGTETVGILRNPRRAMLGAPNGGGGGGNTITITITGNTIANDMDLAAIARAVGEEVEERLSRKAQLLNVNAS